MAFPAKLEGIRTIEEFCDLILDGKMYPQIAALWGVRPSSLFEWLNRDPERAAKAKLARGLASELWDHKALEGLVHAPVAELRRAEAIAHHCRWRAKMYARGTYAEYAQAPEEKTDDDKTVKIVNDLP